MEAISIEKIIDISKSVHELCTTYPEVKEIMAELGFEDIIKPGMLNTVGRFMTIPKGSAMKGISLDKVKEVFEGKGFKIIE
jgi:hypothetical protein